MTKHVVYALFDRRGDLLYVGMTGNLPARLAHHRYTKKWWPLVAESESSEAMSRADALLLERRLIWFRNPLFNRVGRGFGADRTMVSAPIAAQMLGAGDRCWAWGRQIVDGFGIESDLDGRYRYDDIERVARELLDASEVRALAELDGETAA